MEKDDKKIEDLVNKFMEADALESPSLDFTNKVMSKVEALNTSEVTAYKPLIPKYIWWFIASGFIALVSYIFIKQPTESASLSERYNLPNVSFNLLEGLSLNFSNTLMYATVLLVLMLSIQIPLLKQYFNNRLSY